MARQKTSKNVKNPKPRARKPEQQALPGDGYSRKVDPRIEEAEAEVTEARTSHVNAKKDVDDAVDKLVAVMDDVGVDLHKFTDAEGIDVTIRIKPGKRKVVITRKKPRAADEVN